jgi:hypothetical protein
MAWRNSALQDGAVITTVMERKKGKEGFKKKGLRGV